ncbi:MAG: helix-turn-helix transcriptional regulator [Anaerolineae bacterium]|nr:MAG: helix-turn-helix transcriptional regulator [Anaerolineae bacterium]
MDEQELSELLAQWESVYKKGLLTFWILLLLHERPMYVFEMGQALETVSQGTMSADERSLYRALRRFEWSGFVESEWQDSDVGPQRRYYRLSELGAELLRRFTERNILVFQEPEVAGRLARLTDDQN